MLTEEIIITLKDLGYHKRVFSALMERMMNDPDPLTMADFAIYYLQKPWPEAEPIIATEGVPAYRYARYALKGPFPLGEPTIATNGRWAASYASQVLHSRFKLGEPEMLKAHRADQMDDRAVINGYLLDILEIGWGGVDTWNQTGELPEAASYRQ